MNIDNLNKDTDDPNREDDRSIPELVEKRDTRKFSGTLAHIMEIMTKNNKKAGSKKDFDNQIVSPKSIKVDLSPLDVNIELNDNLSSKNGNDQQVVTNTNNSSTVNNVAGEDRKGLLKGLISEIKDMTTSITDILNIGMGTPVNRYEEVQNISNKDTNRITELFTRLDRITSNQENVTNTDNVKSVEILTDNIETVQNVTSIENSGNTLDNELPPVAKDREIKSIYTELIDIGTRNLDVNSLQSDEIIEQLEKIYNGIDKLQFGSSETGKNVENKRESDREEKAFREQLISAIESIQKPAIKPTGKNDSSGGIMSSVFAFGSAALAGKYSFENLMNGLVKSVKDMAKSLGKSLLNGIGKAFTSIASYTKGIFKGFAGSAKGMLKVLGKALLTGFKVAIRAIPFVGQIIAAVEGIYAGVTEYIESGDISKSLAAGVAGFVDGLLLGFIPQKYVDSMKDSLDKAFESTGEYISGVGDKISDSFYQNVTQPILGVFDYIAELFNDLKNGFSNWGDTIGKMFDFDNITDKLSNLVPYFMKNDDKKPAKRGHFNEFGDQIVGGVRSDNTYSSIDKNLISLPKVKKAEQYIQNTITEDNKTFTVQEFKEHTKREELIKNNMVNGGSGVDINQTVASITNNSQTIIAPMANATNPNSSRSNRGDWF